MRFEPRHVKNGAVLRIEYDIGDEVEAEELGYQEADEEANEVEAFADFLRAINDHHGPSTSRHSPKRVYVIVEPGDEHDDAKSRAAGGTETSPEGGE